MSALVSPQSSLPTCTSIRGLPLNKNESRERRKHKRLFHKGVRRWLAGMSRKPKDRSGRERRKHTRLFHKGARRWLAGMSRCEWPLQPSLLFYEYLPGEFFFTISTHRPTLRWSSYPDDIFVGLFLFHGLRKSAPLRFMNILYKARSLFGLLGGEEGAVGLCSCPLCICRRRTQISA